MAQARLLQTVCAVALLAAAPAFAQTGTNPAPTGAYNSPNAPAARDTMSPAGSEDSASGGSAHRSTMNRHATAGRGDMSQNAAVDQLNDQSYQAAQRGQTFGAADTGTTGTMPSRGPGSWGGTGSYGGTGNSSGLPAGSPSPATAASGAGGGPGSGAGGGAGSGAGSR